MYSSSIKPMAFGGARESIADMAPKEPLYKRTDVHIAWASGLFTIVIGAGAWLGVPGVIIPMALLGFALILALLYVWMMLPFMGRWRIVVTLLVFMGFVGLGWSFWFVFSVQSRIRFLTGSKYPSGGEEARLVVELTNRGKATSLRQWSATLTDPLGRVYRGIPLNMRGDSIEIVGADTQKLFYVLPDCDLRFETMRAVQPGDSVYGIIDVLFPTLSAESIPADYIVELEAEDMLGRKIKTGATTLEAINKLDPDITPCKTLKR